MAARTLALEVCSVTWEMVRNFPTHSAEERGKRQRKSHKIRDPEKGKDVRGDSKRREREKRRRRRRRRRY